MAQFNLIPVSMQKNCQYHLTENFHRNFRINGKRSRLKGPTWPAWVSCEPAITNRSHSKYFLTNRQRQDKTGILFFLTCFIPALFYRCLHPGLTSDLTSFFPLTNFTSSGTFALRKYLSLAFFKMKSDVWRTSAPFYDRSSHIDNLKVAEPFYMRVGYVFEWRFTAGMI